MLFVVIYLFTSIAYFIMQQQIPIYANAIGFHKSALKCQKCKYHLQYSSSSQSKCTRFVKLSNSTHRLLAKTHDIDMDMFANTQECLQNPKLCGPNTKEFVSKHLYWK
jgi:hypothetical protein